MRFIRGCLMGASYVLVLLGSAQAQSIQIGSGYVYTGGNDSQNGNILSAQVAKLSETATVQSLSFYVTAAAGNLILGIYDATGPGGGPGALKATTASFAPTKGWNTAKVKAPVSLPAGSYWLTFLPSSNALGFLKMNTTGNCKYYSYAFGALPTKFSTSPASCNPTTWSFHATLTASSTSTPTAVNGVCGSSNGLMASAKPTTNLCTTGTASAVSGSGPWTWSCVGSNGGSNASCSDKLASTTKINGACGPSNGLTVSAKPTASLCTAGTASTVSGSGPWSWTCAGSGGGSTTACSDKLASSGSGSTGSTGSSGSDPTSGVLPSYDDAYANWKNAGLQSVGGIPNRTTICATVNPLGGGKDDFTNIQNAIKNCPAGEVVQLGAGAFTVHMADLPIQISTGVILRGTGSCTGSSSPYCQTSITVSDGALAYTGGKCGVSTSAEVTCPNGGPAMILVAPVSPDYNYSWAQCGNVGGPVGTGCGAATLAADAAQGQTKIQVSSTAKFSVGMWVLIDEASGAGWVADPLNQWTGYGSVWAASDWLSSSGSPATGRVMWSKSQNGGGWDFGSSYPYQAGSVGCWHSYCDRPTAELHKIASIGAGPCPGTACTLTFDDPLTIAFRQSGNHKAQVYTGLYPNQSGTGTPISFLQYAGVENISLLRAVNGGLEMEFCAYCWVRNVEVGDWYGGGIKIEYSARSEFNTDYVHHAWDSVNNGGEYPIALDNASTEILITNSITNFAGKGMVARAGGAGSVVSYNYIDDTMYDAEFRHRRLLGRYGSEREPLFRATPCTV